MPWYSPILLLFSWGWSAILSVRHKLYDAGVLKSEKGALKTVVIGNLELGGTGKSQLTMLLAEMLSKDKKVAILSRGYGRSTSGYVEVESSSKSSEVGDEPLMFKRRFPKLSVSVCEDRIEGLKRIKQSNSDVDLVLLDDAFQHRPLLSDLSILVTDFQEPYFRQNLLPSGRLRDVQSRASSADLLVVTGCQADLNDQARESFLKNAKGWNPTEVFFSNSVPDQPKPLISDESDSSKKAWLISGIARSNRFEKSASEMFDVLGHLALPDHHVFTQQNLRELREKLDIFDPSDVSVLMTEKDAARADHHLLKTVIHPYRMFYLPLKMQMARKDELHKSIIDHVFGEN
ncbi:MAG: tetraacyldisaccharide 4'-kinase [Flavobacteriales bacterium]|jgi:tetraacyldisaccharide 4'-kinase